MDRTAVFVDAGYLFAAGAKLIAGQPLTRGQLKLDYDGVIDLLTSASGQLTGLPLLRIYWYDGTGTGPTPQQLTLAYRPNVKLRLGFVNSHGEQKGVDSLIVTDMINLARNRAMADAVLMTGDEDIRIGVQQAQEFGVRVHLVGITPARDNQSRFLTQEADSVRELTLEEVQSFLSRAAPPAQSVSPPTPPASSPGLSMSLEAIAQRIAGELSAEEKDAVLKASVGGSVPPPIDRRLLIAASQALGAHLAPEQKRRIRNAFVDACVRSVKA